MHLIIIIIMVRSLLASKSLLLLGWTLWVGRKLTGVVVAVVVVHLICSSLSLFLSILLPGIDKSI